MLPGGPKGPDPRWTAEPGTVKSARGLVGRRRAAVLAPKAKGTADMPLLTLVFSDVFLNPVANAKPIKKVQRYGCLSRGKQVSKQTTLPDALGTGA